MSSVFYTTNAVNSLRFISFFNGYYVTCNQGSTTIINSSPATWFGYSFNHESTHPLGSLRIKDNLNYYWYTHSDNKVYNSNSSNTNANRAFYFEEVTSLPIILNDGGDGNYYATLYLPVDIELSDATAYIPTVSGNELVCNLDNGITQVPAGTGVILKGSSNSATATIISGLSASTSSVLSGYYPTTARNSATCYVFSKVGDNVGFFNYTGDNIPGFKAYLPATALGGGSNGYVLTFTDEDPTAVQSIADSQKVRDAQVFDLQGRKVKNPAKGNIYIQNGKKVLY